MGKAYKYTAFALFIVLFVCFAVPAQAGLGVSVNVGDVEKNCKTFNEYLNYYGGGDCWTCKIFLLIFDAANEISGDIAEKISGPLIHILALGLGLRIVYHSAIFVGQVAEGASLASHLTNIGGMCFRAVFASIFIAGGATVAFDYFVMPVIMSGGQFAISALDAECSVNMGSPSLSSGPLSGAKSTMECMVKAIADGLKEPQAIAASLRCGAMHWRKISVDVVFTSFDFPVELFNPIMWGWGCFLGVFYWATSFLFPLMLIDIVFRLGLIVGFVPVFALAWAFPATTKYTKTGFDIILHCCLTFIVSALCVGMIVAITLHALNYGFDSKNMTLLGEPISIDFIALLKQKKYVDAFDNLWECENAGTVMIASMVISILGIFIAPKPDKLAGAFSGSHEFESCADKVIKACINTVIDIIILIITIISWGATSELYIYKVGNYFKKTADTVQKIEEQRKKLEKIRKRVEKARKRVQRMRKMAQRLEQSKNYL